jgi:hypothetical protein
MTANVSKVARALSGNKQLEVAREGKHADLSSLRKSWPSPFVARQEIKNFCGGMISGKYVANLDSRGLGPPGRIKVGRKVAYPVDALIQWLEERSTVENAK